MGEVAFRFAKERYFRGAKGDYDRLRQRLAFIQHERIM